MARELVVHIAPRFEKRLKKLPKHIQESAIRKDLLFRHEPWHHQLRTHPLRGELEGYYAYSIDRRYRVLFRFLNDYEVIYYDIGTHEIYK